MVAVRFGIFQLREDLESTSGPSLIPLWLQSKDPLLLSHAALEGLN